MTTDQISVGGVYENQKRRTLKVLGIAGGVVTYRDHRPRDKTAALAEFASWCVRPVERRPAVAASMPAASYGPTLGRNWRQRWGG